MLHKQDVSIACFFGMVISVLTLSNGSLWIDEGTTALFASFNSIRDVLNCLSHFPASESQMPGYVVYIWMWTRLFGHSEFMLRAANLPFIFWFYITLMYSSLSKRKIYLIVCILTLSPYMWYHLNEARNTTILVALSFIILIHLHEYFKNGLKLVNVSVVIAAFALGLSFNLLFIFFFIPLVYLVIQNLSADKRSLKNLMYSLKYPLMLFLPLCSALIFYYGYTLFHGAGGMRQQPGISNIVEVFYEYGGFLGLGPPRNNLREYGSLRLSIRDKITLVISLIIFTLAAWEILAFFWKKKQMRFVVADLYLHSFLIAFVVFYAVSMIMHFRFWGRHGAFLYPLLIMYLSVLIDTILSYKPRKYFYMLMYGAMALWFFSDLEIRFDSVYQKENYRLAAEIVKELHTTNHFQVVWAGHDLTAAYYGLTMVDRPTPAMWPAQLSIYSSDILTWDPTIPSKKCILVLFKKYDLFDPNNVVREYAAQYTCKILYETPDFLIYEHTGSGK
jgi:hypothetical protein